MKKNLLSGLLIALILIAAGCNEKKSRATFHSPFHARIAAFTSGLIPTDGNIIIEFADNIDGAEAGLDASPSIITITPKLSGRLIWLDNKTLRFIPSAKLLPDKKWQVTVHLKKIFPDEKDDFFFEFGTLPQNFRISTDALQLLDTDNSESYKLTGKIVVADGVEDKDIEAILKASLGKT